MLIKRDIEEKIEKWLDSPEILAIRGPRQCGKTTLLRTIAEKLAARGIPEGHVFYLTFEEDIVRMKFEENCKEFIKNYLGEGKRYLLLDEVQYIDDVGKKLKLIFDSFPDIKLIITGSSSFELIDLGRYLVGRVVFFDMLPFSFREFLRAKGERYEKAFAESCIDMNDPQPRESFLREELNLLLHEYATFGAYPCIVLEKDNEKKKELLKNMFVTYVEKDVVARFGTKFRDPAVKMLRELAAMLGSVVSYRTLGEGAGLTYREVREVLPVLQDSFVISIVRPFHRNAINELRKNPKIYFVDCGIRNYLAGTLDTPSFGPLYENYIHNELARSYTVKYWRTTTKTEVDFIIEKKDSLLPVEVKATAKITRSLRSFIEKYQSTTAIIATLNDAGEEKVGACRVIVTPLVSL